MRLIFFLIVSIVIITGCNKSSEPDRFINCDGLVTDTLGTGDNGRIYMPNAFSPNFDGLNDICRPITQNVDSIWFTVYDQNNMVLFTTTVLGQGWPASQGNNTAIKYYYKIQVVTASGNRIGKCGEVYGLTCFPINPPKSFYYFEDMLTVNGFTGTTAEPLSTCF